MKDNKLNIVIINPDQMRSDYCTPGGHPFINTHNIDKLAKKGTHFTNAFTTCPMCAPSRTSFITGQYPIEHQVRNYVGTMPVGYPNMLSTLKQQGYRIGLFGKDHIIQPNAIGIMYDEGEDICLGNMDKHAAYKNSFDSGTLATNSEYNITERLTTDCLSFIKKQITADQPFFATINMQDPHPYFSAPAPYDTMFNPEQFSLPGNYRKDTINGETNRLSNWRIHSNSKAASELDIKKAMAMYCGQIRYVDDQVGRVIDTLENLNQLDNTIIIFWSDHGEFLGDYGVTHKGLMFYDCLVKIPLIIYDPSKQLNRGENTDLIEVVDILPTVLSILGIKAPSTSRGKSLLSKDYHARRDVFAEGGIYAKQPTQSIADFTIKAPHDPTQWGPGSMLRTKQHKLVIYSDDICELFDLLKDPLETTNLFDSPAHQQLKQELLLRLMTRQQAQGQAPEHLPDTAESVFLRNPKSYHGDFTEHKNLIRLQDKKLT